MPGMFSAAEGMLWYSQRPCNRTYNPFVEVGHLATTELLKNSVCEWRVAWEPLVEDKKAGALAGDESCENCLINHL